MDDERLRGAEAARIRRRDRDATAQSRALMRTGVAKVFGQILACQAKDARDIVAGARPKRRKRRAARG